MQQAGQSDDQDQRTDYFEQGVPHVHARFSLRNFGMPPVVTKLLTVLAI
ncbi:MAG TPA: hypothetical protein VKI44_19040 [Acetobacteraceae bacterium]|nr:hypothetical protein [Acetobacteraceae bacterium]